MFSLLRWRLTAQRCVPTGHAFHASCFRPHVARRPSWIHHVAFSSSPRRSEREDGTWTVYYKAFRRNFYFRIFILGMFSGTLIYIGAHVETVSEASGRRRIMLVSEESIERQAVVRYQLMRERVMGNLVGIEDERVRRIHFVFERMLDGNGLTGRGKRWEIMVINDTQEASPTTETIALILPGNKVIISTSTISALSNTELVHLLAHPLAHMLLQHRRECQSFSHLVTPFVWTFVFLDPMMCFAQLPVLWIARKVYKRRQEKILEVEANRMARILSEKAGFGGLIEGDEEKLGCGAQVRM